TFLRTTLRYPSFNRGWNIMVNAEFTSKTDGEAIRSCITLKDWFQFKMEGIIDLYPEEEWDDDFIDQVDFLGMRSDDPIPENADSSAAILLKLLEKNLVMEVEDKDMVVMLHEIEYEL